MGLYNRMRLATSHWMLIFYDLKTYLSDQEILDLLQWAAWDAGNPVPPQTCLAILDEITTTTLLRSERKGELKIYEQQVKRSRGSKKTRTALKKTIVPVFHDDQWAKKCKCVCSDRNWLLDTS